MAPFDMTSCWSTWSSIVSRFLVPFLSYFTLNMLRGLSVTAKLLVFSVVYKLKDRDADERPVCYSVFLVLGCSCKHRHRHVLRAAAASHVFNMWLVYNRLLPELPSTGACLTAHRSTFLSHVLDRSAVGHAPAKGPVHF